MTDDTQVYLQEEWHHDALRIVLRSGATQPPQYAHLRGGRLNDWRAPAEPDQTPLDPNIPGVAIPLDAVRPLHDALTQWMGGKPDTQVADLHARMADLEDQAAAANRRIAAAEQDSTVYEAERDEARATIVGLERLIEAQEQRIADLLAAVDWHRTELPRRVIPPEVHTDLLAQSYAVPQTFVTGLTPDQSASAAPED